MTATAMANMIGALRGFSWPRLWLGIWLFGWALCIVLSLVSPLQVGVSIDNSDKIGHFLAYATLSAWRSLTTGRWIRLMPWPMCWACWRACVWV
jgi:hypothetical protein